MIDTQQIAALCKSIDPQSGIESLLSALKANLPDLKLHHVLSRSGWHRQGGVITSGYERIARNIESWAEAESGGDLEGLLAYYVDSGYLATRLAGTTLYFTAPIGAGAAQFIQLEVELLQEVVDHALVDPEWLPDDIQDFCDPVECTRLAPDSVGPAFYRFRRVVAIDSLVEEVSGTERSQQNLQRFLQEWDISSTESLFCNHWVIALQEYNDREGVRQYSARPIPTYSGALPDFSCAQPLRGIALANTIHGYDRQIGYPFAWYFMLLGSRSQNHALSEAVLQDQMGAYDYLPARDLKILRQWAQWPYSV